MSYNHILLEGREDVGKAEPQTQSSIELYCAASRYRQRQKSLHPMVQRVFPFIRLQLCARKCRKTKRQHLWPEVKIIATVVLWPWYHH